MDRRYIMYLLLDDKENLTWQTATDHVKIIVKKGNKQYLTGLWGCGIRMHKVYLDGRLNTKEYQEWIDTCIKPMCNIRGAEGIIFI